MRDIFKPSLVVLSGPPLHGKSTVGECLAALSNLVHIDVDMVRRQHFPGKTGMLLPKDEEISVMCRTYEYALAEVARLIAAGTPVVLSGTCSRAKFKNLVVRFMVGHSNVPARIFRLDIGSFDVIRERIASRATADTPSPIKTEEQYRWALGIVEPWLGNLQPTIIDAEQSVESITEDVLNNLSNLQLA